MNRRADLFYDGHALLAEGPVWDSREEALLWVDIDAGKVHRRKTATAAEHMDVGQKVGAVALRGGGGFVLALKEGFALVDHWGGPVRIVARPEKDKPRNRMNDGKCDGAGRFWAGTMGPEKGDGALYRLDADGSTRTMVDGVTISNGLGWSLDQRTMYFIDTPTQRIDAFSYDATSGDIRDRRSLIEVPKEHGSPDGMCVDAEGCLWVAFWGGNAVRRYTSAGALDETIEVAASQVTSCTFGGADLSELYITTASVGLSPTDAHAQPHAGGVFVVHPGVKGLPASAFSG
jgi:sugar lactone lactonase YvrE